MDIRATFLGYVTKGMSVFSDRPHFSEKELNIWTEVYKQVQSTKCNMR